MKFTIETLPPVIGCSQQVEMTLELFHKTEAQKTSHNCNFSPCGQRTSSQKLSELCRSEFIVHCKIKGNYHHWLFATCPVGITDGHSNLSIHNFSTLATIMFLSVKPQSNDPNFLPNNTQHLFMLLHVVLSHSGQTHQTFCPTLYYIIIFCRVSD